MEKKQAVIAAVVMGVILSLVAIWQVAGPELAKLAGGKRDAATERPKRKSLHELITESDAAPSNASFTIDETSTTDTTSNTTPSMPTATKKPQTVAAVPASPPPAVPASAPPSGEEKPARDPAETNAINAAVVTKPESNAVAAMISQLVVAPAGNESSEEKSTTAAFATYAEIDALHAPVAWFEKAGDGDRVKYTGELRALLSKGLEDGPAGLDTARKRFDAAKKICADDPRLAYAFAIALWKHGQQKEALDHMQQASKQTKPRYYPALVALAWMHLSRNDQAKGLPALRDLLAELARPVEGWPGENALTHVATRLGRIVGFFRVSELPEPLATDYEKLDTEITSRLSESLREAYTQGRTAVAADMQLIRFHAARPAEELEKDAREALDLYQTEFAELSDSLQELQKEIDELDTGLEVAGKNQSTADRRARLVLSQYQKSVSAVRELSKPRTYRESMLVPVTRTDSSGRATTRYETRTISRPENSAERANRLAALEAEQTIRQNLQLQLTDAQKSAKDFKDENVDSKVEDRPTLQLKQAEAEVLKRRRADTEARIKLLRETPPTPAALTARAKQLATFVPFDPLREKQNLQATLSAKPKPATKPAADAKSSL